MSAAEADVHMNTNLTTIPAPTSDAAADSQPIDSMSDARPVPEETDTPLVEAREPQNPLTEQFTSAEWEALKKFKAILPDILAEAHPEKADARTTPITLWGVEIKPNGPNNARVSVILMKFLRARNLSIQESKDMLVSTLRWREQFDIESVLKEEFSEEIFKQLGHVYGLDKGGRPVVYNLYGATHDLKAVFSNVQRFIRWRVALMERSVLLLDFENVDQTLQIHDYEGVSFTSRDANSKNAASEATSIFQNHYPEMLYKKFFVNVPTILNWIFWAFKSLISAKTIAKMNVVGTGHNSIKHALLPYIEASNLPTRYGGEAQAF